MRLFNLSAQGAVEMQFLKHLSTLRAAINSPVQMTDSNNSLLRSLNHILYINLKLLHAHSADRNAFKINKTPCSLDAFNPCFRQRQMVV